MHKEALIPYLLLLGDSALVQASASANGVAVPRPSRKSWP